MNKKIVIAIVVIVLVLAAAYGVYESREKNVARAPGSTVGGQESGVIKIGFIGPQSGDVATIGDLALTSAQLAVQEVNDAGGVNGRKLELIVEDSKCDPAGGTTAVNKLVNVDQVTVIVGGACSSETAPAAPIAQAAGVPMMSYCASAPGITKVGNYIFRDYPSDTFQSRFSAEYAFNTLKKKTAAVFYVKNDWGQGMHDGFLPRFQELGGKVVADESFTQDARDFRTQITKIKAAHPDIIIFYSYTEAGIAGLKQMKELGVKGPFLGGDAWDDPKISQEAKAAAEGIMYSVPHTDIPEDFAKKFNAASGKEAKICTPQAYDAVKLFAAVMKAVGTDRKAIRDGLAQTKDYKGVSGNITFQGGDITNATYDVKVVKNGKSELAK